MKNKIIDFLAIAGKSSECNLLHLCNPIRRRALMKVTGYSKEQINVGDELKVIYNKKIIYNTVKYVVRRNHRGIFEDPKDNIETFFAAVCIPSEKSKIA